MKNHHRLLQLQQQRVERIDMQYRLYTDMQNITHSIGGCCFKTLNHIICYDIKNNQFRRRKKSWSGSRFYTHYIGKKKQFKTIQCEATEDTVTIEIDLKASQQSMVFHLTRS